MQAFAAQTGVAMADNKMYSRLAIVGLFCLAGEMIESCAACGCCLQVPAQDLSWLLRWCSAAAAHVQAQDGSSGNGCAPFIINATTPLLRTAASIFSQQSSFSLMAAGAAGRYGSLFAGAQCHELVSLSIVHWFPFGYPQQTAVRLDTLTCLQVTVAAHLTRHGWH